MENATESKTGWELSGGYQIWQKKKKKSLQVAVEIRIYIESGVNRTLEKQWYGVYGSQ